MIETAMNDYSEESKIEKLEALIKMTGNIGELEYFTFHRERFRKTCLKILELAESVP